MGCKTSLLILKVHQEHYYFFHILYAACNCLNFRCICALFYSNINVKNYEENKTKQNKRSVGSTKVQVTTSFTPFSHNHFPFFFYTLGISTGHEL